MRIGMLDATYHPNAAIATGGQSIPGAAADVSHNVTPMFDIGYGVTKAFSLQVMGGVPPKPTVTGERAVASLGALGAVRFGPVFLTGLYHVPHWRGWRPYVGAGAVYAGILRDHDRAMSDPIFLNNWGCALQGGVERSIANKLDVFVDFKEAWLAVNAHGNVGGAIPVTARIGLDPSIVGLGLKVRFH